MTAIHENRIRNIGLIFSLLGIAGCLLMLLPQTRTGVIGLGEAFLHRPLGWLDLWNTRMMWWAIGGLIGFICLLLSSIQAFEPWIRTYTRPPVLLVLLSALIFASIAVRIIMYAKMRSLWVDEAMLAESLVTRNFRELLASPLAHIQTAPALYLLTVKALCAVFGYTETALRLFSLFAFFGVLAVEFLLVRKAFQLSRVAALFAAAITATLPLFMRYSNELKPYMGDAFFVLAVLLIYHGYSAGSLKLPLLTVLYSVILLFSSPVLFFIASVFMVEFIHRVIEKDWKQVRNTTIAGIITLGVFIIYYILWLMPVAENPEMVNFWENNRFYVLTFELGKIRNNIVLVVKMLGIPGFLYALFGFMGFVISIKQKNKIAFVTGLSVVLLLIASNVEKYPIVARLYMFIYPLIILFMIICFTSMCSMRFVAGMPLVKNMAGSLLVLCAMLNMSFLRFAEDDLYLKNQEGNPLIAYIREHIKDDEYLYAFLNATYVLRFKNGYDTAKIGNVSKDNIIYGGRLWSLEEKEYLFSIPYTFEQDIEKIMNAKKCYLLYLYENVGSGLSEPFIEHLKTLGSLEEVMSFHETLLFYFTADNGTEDYTTTTIEQ